MNTNKEDYAKMSQAEREAKDKSDMRLGAGCLLFVLAIGTLAMMLLTLRLFGVY